MPQFFFNFSRGGAIAQDPEGLDTPNLEAAKALAIQSVRELLADNIKANVADPIESVIVTDESGAELLTIRARDVLPERLKK
jgi:hypothetical protein